MWRKFGAAAVTLSLLAGCGGEHGYDVSGDVTFDGKPVPAGSILFTPDGSKGNTGPTGYATITDGHYDTAAAGGKPTIGGPMIVAIEGQDPSAPAPQDAGNASGEKTIKTLFPHYETAVELPKESTTKDFEVPAEAAHPTSQSEQPVIVP